ncbi:alpha/beta fold hydrolase [Sinorhizobium meliloti]
MSRINKLLATAAIAAVSLITVESAVAATKAVVLVHGAAMDGSGWKAVYNILREKGFDVRIVQQPLSGFENDVAATKRTIDAVAGKIVLVGHSYGGAVITEAGTDPKVGALVYVAGQQPDQGETVRQLNAQMPPAIDGGSMEVTQDGYLTIGSAAFIRDVAGDLPTETAAFLAASQVPTNVSAFSHVLTSAAWHDKPTFAIVATDDRTINPDLQRWMYARSKSKITEIKASHLLHISHPAAVADVIARAAEAVVE